MNREVQIRLGIGNRTGQRTDIYVDAVTERKPTAGYDQIHTITEVKGNWNKELRTAMKTQLRNRYLEDSHSDGKLLPSGGMPGIGPEMYLRTLRVTSGSHLS